MNHIQNELNALKCSQAKEIKIINKLASFSNTVSRKLYEELNLVNLNVDMVRNMLQKSEFKVGMLEHYQYIVMCLNRLTKIVETIEDTINLSFSDTTNVKLFSQKDLNSIVNHLRSIYPAKSIVHTDPYHLYENLKFTKTQVVMLDLEMIVILSVPLIEGNNYQLYSIYPAPTDNKDILVPSEKYYLQGSSPKWSNVPCSKGTQLYVCLYYNIRITLCNLTNPTGCEFAAVENDLSLFHLLNSEHILFFSKNREILLQTCVDSQTTTHVTGLKIIYTNQSCPISSMGITIEPKPTNYTQVFPIIKIPDKPYIRHKISFQHSHLDVNQLKLDLQPIDFSNDTEKETNVINVTVLIILSCILIFMFRTQLYKVYWKCKSKKVKIAEDSNQKQGVEELRSLPDPPVNSSSSPPIETYKF